MSDRPTAPPEVDPGSPVGEPRGAAGPDAPDPAPDAPDAAEAEREALRAERVAALEEALRLEEGQSLERAYLFDPLERKDVAFSLALVVKRVGEERLEMVAIGARAAGTEAPVRDFVRRATFPDPVLPQILEEFIDRCGVEEAVYREVSLVDPRSEDGDAIDPTDALAAALFPA